VAHLFDVLHVRLNRREKCFELGTRSKSFRVPLFGIPFDPEDVAFLRFRALGELIGLAVAGSVQRCPCVLVGFLKVCTSRLINLVSDVFNDHGLLPLALLRRRREAVFCFHICGLARPVGTNLLPGVPNVSF
jgi:hypothetical protein